MSGRWPHICQVSRSQSCKTSSNDHPSSPVVDRWYETLVLMCRVLVFSNMELCVCVKAKPLWPHLHKGHCSSSLVVCTVAKNPSHRMMSTSNSLETANLCFYWDAQICWWSVNEVLLTRLPFSLLIPMEVARVQLLFFHTASSFWLCYGSIDNATSKM